jgi:hypothetical protein
VRAHLDRQDLTAARAVIRSLPAAEAEDPTVRPLLGEVKEQEARRDRELKAARECLRNSEWECAANRARSALAIDRSSDEAQQIVKGMGMRSLGLDPQRTKETQPPRPPVKSSPAPSGGTAAPGLGAVDASTPAECEAALAAGRRALAARRFDEAIERANDPIGALGFCPELEKVKQDATRAKNEAAR